MRGSEPVALTIAGSDSGGEAGIQADLKTFSALGVHGTTAVTCLTAQNPRAVSQIQAATPKMVPAQLEAVATHFDIAAAKTGMLYSEDIVREVVRFKNAHPKIPLVVDPVIISTSGRRLLQAAAVKILKSKLLPLATIVTPNISEAEILIDSKIHSFEEMREAAKRIYREFSCGALVKGGHMPGTHEAVDFYHGPEGEWMLSAPRVTNPKLHGTGCTYSAAITAWLARGKSKVKAIELAKVFITQRIRSTTH